MIIGRSPLRITLGGGGTDLQSFFSKHEGFLIAAAIDQYVYTTINDTNSDDILIRYSQIEKVKNVGDIHHPIIREALKLMGIAGTHLEITSMADQGAGTGLGSSGSFTTCLLKVLHKYKNSFVSQHDLAKLACHIEIDLLHEPIGFQDQFIAAFGGLTTFEFKKDGTVIPKPLNISKDNARQLQENLVMFSTGYSRSASAVLKDQNDKSNANDNDMINNLLYVKELGYKSLEALESGNFVEFGKIMHEHWQHKKKRSPNMSNPDIDKWYELAMANGAIGGKLNGAGSGGFLMFCTEERVRLQKAFKAVGLKDTPIRFDYEGTKIL
jgi:D-glycero-alpha-D-manno-heptose-7-phosphate kinase